MHKVHNIIRDDNVEELKKMDPEGFVSANKNIKNKDVYLLLACALKREKIIRYLLEIGANAHINIEDFTELAFWNCNKYTRFLSVCMCYGNPLSIYTLYEVDPMEVNKKTVQLLTEHYYLD